MNRKEFLRQLGSYAAVLAAAPRSGAAALQARGSKRPRAIAMWDFSWLERRWPGAGYEDWDRALDELVERGYDALRIDAYPHLVAADPNKNWLLIPVWDTQDWGAPTLVRVRVMPELLEFLAKCRDRHIKVGLSTWYREDEDKVRSKLAQAEQMAEAWNSTLARIKRAGLLDEILYVDLCNEWPGAPWSPIAADWPDWTDPRALAFMRAAIAGVRAEFPDLPLLFSTNTDRVEDFAATDLGFMDAIEHHLWMAGENGDEFYQRVGYRYQQFSQEGYHNVQLSAAGVYAEKPRYWRRLLTDKIDRLADAARRGGHPLMTTECWAIIDYKDWPMLPWDWVKDLCAVGTSRASASGQWLAVATSNFCGPQFHGMWSDVAWHRRLTDAVKAGPVDAALRTGRLWNRL